MMTFLSNSKPDSCIYCNRSGIVAGQNEYETLPCAACNGTGLKVKPETYRLDFTIQELDILNRYMLGESFSNTDWNKFYMLKIRITNYMDNINNDK